MLMYTTLTNVKSILLVFMVTKLYALIADLVNRCKCIKLKTHFPSLLKKMLEEFECCEIIIKRHFKKELIMTEENERNFQMASECHLCDKLYHVKGVKVRDHCKIRGKYRGFVHQRCNVNSRLTQKISVIFHNFKGCAAHHIIQDIGMLGQKISVVPNGMEIYNVLC